MVQAHSVDWPLPLVRQSWPRGHRFVSSGLAAPLDNPGPGRYFLYSSVDGVKLKNLHMAVFQFVSFLFITCMIIYILSWHHEPLLILLAVTALQNGSTVRRGQLLRKLKHGWGIPD